MKYVKGYFDAKHLILKMISSNTSSYITNVYDMNKIVRPIKHAYEGYIYNTYITH